jgi:hypothetical protein
MMIYKLVTSYQSIGSEALLPHRVEAVLEKLSLPHHDENNFENQYIQHADDLLLLAGEDLIWIEKNK